VQQDSQGSILPPCASDKVAIDLDLLYAFYRRRLSLSRRAFRSSTLFRHHVEFGLNSGHQGSALEVLKSVIGE
jgi:hypothetical protein